VRIDEQHSSCRCDALSFEPQVGSGHDVSMSFSDPGQRVTVNRHHQTRVVEIVKKGNQIIGPLGMNDARHKASRFDNLSQTPMEGQAARRGVGRGR